MKLTRKVLGAIYESCEGACYYCGSKLAPFGDWDVDHMTPVIKGGVDAFHNLVLACRRCNRSKGGRTVEEFRAEIKRRALNFITRANEGIAPYFREPDTDYQRAVDHLEQAGNALAQADIIFHGEARTLPRKDDPLFTEENDAAFDEASVNDGDGLTVN